MIPSEKEKLFASKQKPISIGLTIGGTPLQGFRVPWEKTSSAFNMRTPQIYMCEEDLYDEEILAALKENRVIGFYAFYPLRSYSVLEQFTDLQDIYLLGAKFLKDLSFIANMPDWFMLFVHDAHLPDLAPLVQAQNASAFGHSYCLGFHSCQIDDISALYDSPRTLYELIIWNKLTREEYDRWEQADALSYRYYDI